MMRSPNARCIQKQRSSVSLTVQLGVQILPTFSRFNRETGARPVRRVAKDNRVLRRVGIAVLVVFGHGLLLWLLVMGTEPKAALPPAGAAAIGLDLVGTAPVAVPSSPRTTLARSRPKVAVRLDHVETDTAVAQADTEVSDIAYTFPPVTSSDSPPVLSDADSQALSQFQPASAPASPVT